MTANGEDSMAEHDRYARHSAYTAPGAYRELLAAAPIDLAELSALVRNVLVHYRGGGVDLSGERLAEIDNQARHPWPLAQPRDVEQRVAGCCRDFTLLGLAALRERGVPARSRIGFAGYFEPGFWVDHVLAEVWTGDRWRFADLQLDPAGPWGFDVHDVPLRVGPAADPTPVFATAAQVWTAYRRGDIDPDHYGVGVGVPIGGPWFIRNYVLNELAHRHGDELLLWDVWGDATRPTLDGTDLGLVDEVAALLLAADDGDGEAERQLAERYRSDPRLRPAQRVLCVSPRGVVAEVDLGSRAASPVAPADWSVVAGPDPAS
jgi:hypothetical protein